MKLFLANSEDIYFPQIKVYFREIASSFDNGNYRSAMVMLYSTIVCDLLLKLKELSEVYSDEKADGILKEIDRQRKNNKNSVWEWNLIEKIREQTELLSDDSYTMIKHIYDIRNFSAHPAMNEEYELISPTAEMAVAYIKKALDEVFIKPSVFAQNIVDRMSDDISAKKDIYRGDYDSFKIYLNKVYFERMSEKMANLVFKAFWKFVFLKGEDEAIYRENRIINRRTLEALLERFGDTVCSFIEANPNYFSVITDSICLKNLCILLSKFPKVYRLLEMTTQYHIKTYSEEDIEIIKWFVSGDLKQHIDAFQSDTDILPKACLELFKQICLSQGMPNLFPKLLIKHYAGSDSFTSAKNRFDNVVKYYLSDFCAADFIELINVINRNDQIYNYFWQIERNDIILEYALPLLPTSFDFDDYPNFHYSKPRTEEIQSEEGVEEEDNIEYPF